MWMEMTGMTEIPRIPRKFRIMEAEFARLRRDRKDHAGFQEKWRRILL